MKTFTALALLLTLTSATNAQVSRGVVKEGLTIDSKILGTKVRYTIYLPFDYETSSRFYPVVYLLHGYTDNDMGWIQFGEANLIADEAIAKREIPAMIVAMPDAGPSWYINNYNGSVRYEDFFFGEFMPHIESRYRIRAEKNYRGVAGLSMGGFGTLVYVMRHPDQFAASAALSAAVNTTEQIVAMDERGWSRWPTTVYGPGSGEARLTEHLLSYNPIRIVETGDIEKLKSVKIYLDCGDDDYLTIGNAMLHVALTKRQIPHEYRVRDGAHIWSYWRSGLAEALKFIGTSFHKP
ncbi:esterase family protein [candidate division KSB1 bacterium]|nr:esterase family protein [candidate division KSB1 bacterium]